MTPPPGLGLEPGDPTPLVAGGSTILSRGDLRSRADALAAVLRERGLGRVLVRSDDPERILGAVDAANRTGADLWIAHTNIPADIIEETKARFGIQMTVGETEELRPEARADGAGPPAARVHMMTSGTTGRPKVAVHTLEALLSRARAGAGSTSPAGGKWLLTYQPTGFAGLQVQLTAVAWRGVVVVPPERTPPGFYEAAVQHRVTQISATPTFWRAFLMVSKPGALDLRQITLGGEAADQATLDRLKKAFPDARITHIYASTEAGVVFAVHDGMEGFPTAWLERPIQGVEVRIRDGLLQIKTPNAMRGYATETTQPLLEDGWLATADRCEIVGDRVRVLGRQDSTINVGGSKVYPLAVESFLLGLPGVVEARVYGVKNPISGALVAAEVVLGPGEEPDAAKARILAACREKLPGYQIPRVFKVVDTIQVRESGKKAMEQG